MITEVRVEKTVPLGAGDAFEMVLTTMEPTGGIDTYQFSDNALAADTYNVIFSLLDTKNWI